MDRPGLITLCGAADDPLAHVRLAMLVLAIFVAAVGVPIMLGNQIPNHAVRIDLAQPVTSAALGGPRHRLRIEPNGEVFFDGGRCRDLIDLRAALDRVAAEPGSVVEVRPHPEGRYETFLEILALVKRANPAYLRLDNEAPDEWGQASAVPTGLRDRQHGGTDEAETTGLVQASRPVPPRVTEACRESLGTKRLSA